jgi:hypothetical protein
MNDDMRARFLGICRKYDGATSRDIALAMVAANIEVVKVMLLEMAHEHGSEAMRKAFARNEKLFLDSCDDYLSLILHPDPTRPAPGPQGA